MKYLTRFFILLCWMLLIFMLLTMPMQPSTGYSFTWYDKLVHIFLFGAMAFLTGYFLALFPRLQIRLVAIISVITSILYSAVTEYCQLFVPGRSMSEYDFLAGAIGAFIAAILIYEKFGKKT